MDTRKIMLIVGALVIAIGAAFGVNQMMRGASTPEARAAAAPNANGPMILVATRQLPLGTIIGPDSFRFQPWPKELVEKAYFLKDKTDANSLVGTVVRYPITAGQPLTQGALVHPDDRGFLAAALGPGMRAVTVKVSQEQGVAGFVFPGDRVDVVLTRQIDKGNATTEVVLQNARVLAVDQSADERSSKPAVAKAVTLEVDTVAAQKVWLAASVGNLSLLLRKAGENAPERTRRVTLDDLSKPERMARGRAAGTVNIMVQRGANKQEYQVPMEGTDGRRSASGEAGSARR